MTNRELYEKWMHRLKEGLRYRKEEARDEDWQVAWKAFKNQYEMDVQSDNVTFSAFTQMILEASPRNPSVVVTSLRPGGQAAAMVLQQLDRQLLAIMNLPPQFELALLDSATCGLNGLKMGYDSRFGYEPKFELPSGGTLTQYGKSGRRLEFPRASPGFPWAERTDPRDIVFPYGTVNVETAPWMATRHIRYLKDVKEDVKFNARARGKLAGSGTFDPASDSSTRAIMQEDSSFSGDPRIHTKDDEKLVYWEIFDRWDDEIIVIAQGNPGIILRKGDSLLLRILDSHPAILRSANPDGRCVWGDSDWVQIASQQFALNNFNSQFNEIARLLVPRLIGAFNKLTPESKGKLAGSTPGAALELAENANIDDIRKIFMVLNIAMPPELPAVMEETRSNIRSKIGFNRIAMGEHQGPPRRTATEVDVMQAAKEERVERKRLMVESMLKELVQKANKLVFALWREPQWIRVVGPGAVQYVVEFTGHDLEGEYKYEITPEDRRMATSEQRRAEALTLLGAIDVLREAGVDIRYVIQQILRHFPELDLALAIPMQQAEEPIGVEELGMKVRKEGAA